MVPPYVPVILFIRFVVCILNWAIIAPTEPGFGPLGRSVGATWFADVGATWFVDVGATWFADVGATWFVDVGATWFVDVGATWQVAPTNCTCCDNLMMPWK